jgi:hypothetical protein
MHRNTFLLVLGLSIFAALVVGVNVGKKMAGSPTGTSQGSPTPTTTPTLSAQAPKNLVYISSICGYSLTHPESLTLVEDATGSAMLLNANDKTTILMTCQKDIPRPPIPTSFIETRILNNPSKTASISAKLYHDHSEKDGTPLDALIYHNTTIGKDVFIAGFGEDFNTVLSTLTLIP